MYELFQIQMLQRLDTQECGELWASLTGDKLKPPRMRPLQILTDGNPRLLVILATFATHASLRTLLMNLTALVDEHTEYFKSILESAFTNRSP